MENGLRETPKTRVHCSPISRVILKINSGLAELNSTKAIAVYLEVEFHDTKDGANWIINNVKAIGEAIAQGVWSFMELHTKLTEQECPVNSIVYKLEHLKTNQMLKTAYKKPKPLDLPMLL